MKTAGIICEYNPFHSGHKYQIEKVKQNFDAVVCVMSGSIVQRGDIAIFDKWTRTKSALCNGCDLVIELPVKYALSSAEGFASGSVKLLGSTGIIDALCFGSESGKISELTNCAKTLLSEPPEVSAKIKALLDNGLPFVKARSMAYKEILDTDLPSEPNNILAIEYIKAILMQKSDITPVTIKRMGAGYHDTAYDKNFVSATYLREKIRNGEDISGLTPYDFSGSIAYDINQLTDIFKYKLITEKESAFDGICDMEPGLANRFLKELDKEQLTDIIDAVKTKRYTYARLFRIALSVLLGLKVDTVEPEYIRILGMNTIGKQLLSKMKSTSRFPIINKVANFKNNMILPDILATDLAALCASVPVPLGRDYTTSPIIIE